MNGLYLKDLHLRSEDQLLLACASTRPDEKQCKEIRRLAGECEDWDYVLQAARYHGLTPLVSLNLDDAAPDIVPREPLELLRRGFRANAARNLFLTQELLSVIREFGAHGIDAIPLKGPLLAMTAYGNVALREFLDLDVLVPRQHLDRAGELLMQRGYQQPPDQAGARGLNHVEAQLGCDFSRKDGQASVELHWSFLQKWLGFEVDLDSLWKAPDHVSVGGTDVLKLPAEITLLYLCAHGTKHRWSRLCWVADVAHVLRAQLNLEWDKLLETAKSTGCRRTFFLGLYLAHELLNVDLPQEVWTQMKSDGSAFALSKKICSRVFSSRALEAPMRAGMAKDWFYLSTKERWKDRLRYLHYLAGWLFLPSQKDRQWIPLPASLGWLYMFLRPIRAACAAVQPRFRNGASRPPR